MPDDLKLIHYGKSEVLQSVDLMEEEYDNLMVFDPALYGGQGQIVQGQFDPSQFYTKRGKVPHTNLARNLKDVKTYMSDELGFPNSYEHLACEAYLKANSRDPKEPLRMYPVSGRLYWTVVDN